MLAEIEVLAGARFRDVGLGSIADDDPISDVVLLEAADDGRLWVVEIDGEVVGYALAELLGEADDPSVRPHLEQVSVVPAAGGRGAGAALVEEVAAWGRSVGGRSLSLTTFRDLPWNAPWYRRLGFEVIPDDALDHVLRSVRDHEAELGIDVAPRVVMCLDLGVSGRAAPPGSG